METSQYTAHHSYDLENAIDPDNNFLLEVEENCFYYTGDQLNQSLAKEGNTSIGLIHFNSRSLSKNFKDIRDYLDFYTAFQHYCNIRNLDE